MNKKRFNDLRQAIRQAGLVQRGESAPVRAWKVTRGKDGKIIRHQIDRPPRRLHIPLSL